MDIPSLSSNQFFSGGLVLMVLGAAFVWLKGLPRQIYNFVERWFILKMEILDEDEAYGWMQIWLAENLHKTLSVSVITKRPHIDDSIDTEVVKHYNKPQVYFVPAVGTYFFWYGHRLVTLNRDRKENSTSNIPLVAAVEGKGTLRTKESFTLRIFSWNKNLAKRLIEECRDKAMPDDGKLDIRIATYGYWSLGTRIKPRSIESVVLDGNQTEELLADIDRFQESRDWYESVGVPFRRTYLFEGFPGSGKTSIIKAIAGKLKRDIYLMMLSDSDMTDNRVNELLSKIPENSILLLEDIDCAFNQRERNGKEGLTFAGLLNAIDGVATPEGRLAFFTTNHMERLDPALIRPGRADVKIHFGNATRNQAQKLFDRFFPQEKFDFGQLIEDQKYSMATLQNYLMLYRHSAIEAIRNVGEINKLQIVPVEENDKCGENREMAIQLLTKK